MSDTPSLTMGEISEYLFRKKQERNLKRNKMKRWETYVSSQRPKTQRETTSCDKRELRRAT